VAVMVVRGGDDGIATILFYSIILISDNIDMAMVYMHTIVLVQRCAAKFKVVAGSKRGPLPLSPPSSRIQYYFF